MTIEPVITKSEAPAWKLGIGTSLMKIKGEPSPATATNFWANLNYSWVITEMVEIAWIQIDWSVVKQPIWTKKQYSQLGSSS